MARLGDIGKIVTGNTPKTSESQNYTSNDICFVKPSDIADGIVTCLNDSEFYISEYARAKARILPPKSVLVTCIGIIGKVAINDVECAFNQQINAIIPDNSKCLTEYLAYAIQNKQPEMQDVANAPVVPILNKTQFSDIEINLPSLTEQEEIVEKLNAVSRLIALRKAQLAKLDQLVKSRFIELFGDLKTNSKGWQIVGFKDCADIDTNMIHDFEGYEDYPHIGIDSIEKETGRLVGYRTILEDGVISGKYLFTPEHIIYSKIRPNLNKVALPDFDGLCSADAYPILVKAEVCNREYLGYTLRSKYFLDYILAFSNRTNLPKVNKNQVEGFKLPLPPIEMQKQFAAFVKQTDKSKLAIQRSLNKLELLKKSLMQKYFG